ncbi:prepilin-type N-terminal cleavage/methylation domain-containing protein [Ilumatobacter fluminis]|uniref:Prepilin-type N-terminal cleavage/methylation domain-containing protein n=1 Tax=Ilumatobacter fluminis TaxID=467091 RepID=A0A4R7I6Y5_9ACTN|nr:prepilin-type N-terminal cleavage/methylation domain-containing protein [Ilumatobacter fluminis]TDT18573.1 prepilin-type N-terminal cleavage/methylation domain-containing protein [Ilumatobacter fluminis]
MIDRPNAHDRDGFTLIEILIVVTIMGVIAAAISVAFTVVMRTAPPTEARADDARSLLGISTWLPADVSATPNAPLTAATDFWDDAPGRTSGCTGTDPGTNLIRLSWRESISGSPNIYVANYRLVDEGDSSKIVRVTCVNGGTPKTQKLTAGLPLSGTNPTQVTWKTDLVDGVDHIIGVELELRTFEGDTLRVDAASRNPAQTLSTLPQAATTTTAAPTTTTSTTTTTIPNQPPTAGPLDFNANPSVPVTFTLPVNDPEGEALTVTLTNVPATFTSSVSGVDVTLTPDNVNATHVIDYTVTDPGGLSASSTITVKVNPSSTTTTTLPPNDPPTASPVTVAADPGVKVGVNLPVFDPNSDQLTVTLGTLPDGWTAQVVTLDAGTTSIDVEITPAATASPGISTIDYTVTDPDGATASSTIDVDVSRIPCVASIQSVSPNPVSVSGGNGKQAGPLVEDVEVTINKSGNCSELVLRYIRVVDAPNGQASSDDRQPQVDTFGDGIVITLLSSSVERWQKGNRPLELVEFAGLPEEIVHDSETLVVE